ncbi:bile acid:sodium symporter family protein [Actinokineospora iranica]|uniref:Bile acid:Na+ symporter, BASS family n=1 Tax=Actinokineospora iranica TaxID=1271860 RepID=A0A1G6YM80_9PSEU|nr:bile acid:sodium symporter family protein [Actinokineospora iranica]SDD91440.1 bile acid:Na+ symporter, BASS family [Actinokineospora iranica]
MSSPLTTVFLPIALAIIMFGLGLTLTVADFTRVAKMPRAVLLALAVQVIVLPALCLGLVLLFDLEPDLAVGMMLLAASPGGTTANIFSHLAGGDVALNITLTAVNSVLAIVTLPIIVNLSLAGFLGASGTIGLQPGKMLQVFAIVLVPAAVGMAIARRFPAAAAQLRGPVRIASIVVLVAVILGAMYAERANIGRYIGAVGLLAVLLCVLSLAIGYAVPLLAGVPRPQAIASSFEIGIHNSALAITIALSLLNNATMAVPAAVYGVAMSVPAGIFAWLISRRKAPVAAVA